MTKPTLIIDADTLAVTAAAMALKEIPWDDDIITMHVDLNESRTIFTDELGKILAAGDTTDFILCWSCSSRHYFRHDVWPLYKSNRRNKSPVIGFGPVRNWAKEEFTSREIRDLEADDVVGIYATDNDLVSDPVVVSIDKDLKQIPGKHLNPMKLDEGVYTISKDEADHHLWMQVLMGDNVDGYPGCPKVGVVTAEKILKDHDPSEYPMAAWKAYEKAGQSLIQFEAMVNTARILHAGDYDKQKEKVILWKMS